MFLLIPLPELPTETATANIPFKTIDMFTIVSSMSTFNQSSSLVEEGLIVRLYTHVSSIIFMLLRFGSSKRVIREKSTP